jgi:quinol monooxygenase YgiN
MARITHSTSNMIIGTIRILPPADRRADVLEVLRSVQGPIKAQPGCAACDIYDEQGAEPAVVFVERWDSETAFEAHLRSETYRRILGAIELSGGRPDIRFEHVMTSEGMELIERARNPGGTVGMR